MRSRAKYRMAQFGLVGEQLMSSPFAKDYECQPPTTSVGYNLALHEVHEKHKSLPQENIAETKIELEHVEYKQAIVEKSNYDSKLYEAGSIDESRARRLLRQYTSD